MMRYMGGKQRQSKALSVHVSGAGSETYYEPFMGALGSAEKVVPVLARQGVEKFVFSDSSAPLVGMWRSVFFEGWVPPDWVSEDEYQDVRLRADPADPLLAWCGYGLSFGGKWFGGFARGGSGGQSSEKMQANQKKSLLRKRDAIAPYNPEIRCACYSSVLVEQKSTVYCDPPYAGRTKAHHTTRDSHFAHDDFWRWAREIARTSRVYVTEFVAPSDWVPIYSWGDTVVRHRTGGASDGTSESLFVLEGGFGTPEPMRGAE
jgi:DNA adenine methylase